MTTGFATALNHLPDQLNTLMNRNETEEQPRPLPLPVPAPQSLEFLAPLPELRDTGRELEKGQYWNKLLTGDLDRVPDELRRRAGAGDASLPDEDRDYRLVSAINQSWMVDHKGLSREQVRTGWPELRRLQAQELGVRDDEHEVYAALSVQNEEAPRREQVGRSVRHHYESALKGEATGGPDDATDAEICTAARQLGEQAREQYLPLAEELAAGWTALRALEKQPVIPSVRALGTWPDLFRGVPALWRATDALAGMGADERAQVYMVARSLPEVKALESRPLPTPEAMLVSAGRGVDDLRHDVLQGVGHIGAALVKAGSETLDSPSLRKLAGVADKRLQALDELRRVAQGEVFPIRLDEECHYAEQLAVDVAGVVPGSALCFMGGAGFGVLTVAGTGAAVAEARRRSPQGRQELQTAAGILGGALQATIFAGMSRVGAHMLQRSISSFCRARGLQAYSLASLKMLASITAENVKFLLAGRAAEAGNLAVQELAARADDVASNIDWESYGDNLTDIEANMRLAAMNLPLVLIASGRACLHHFRSREAVLGDGSRLAEWGVREPLRKQIMETADVHAQSELLSQVLRGSRRWSAPGSMDDWMRALSLLNTSQHKVFRKDTHVAEFLQLRPDTQGIFRRQSLPQSAPNPEQVRDAWEQTRSRRPLSAEALRSVEYARIWDEWVQKSNGEIRQLEGENARRNSYYMSLRLNPSVAVPESMRTGNYYQPYREEMMRTLVNDRMREVMELSYELLMNLESMDSLRLTYSDAGEARRACEKIRQGVVSRLLAAMQQTVTAEKMADDAFDLFTETHEQLYLNLRRNREHVTPWLRQVDESELCNMYEKACQKALRSHSADNPQLLDAYRILLGLRHCAESLIALLPHTDRFQALLNNGDTPGGAIVKILRHEFKDHIDDRVWPAAEFSSRSVPAPAEEVIEAYRTISGYDFESSPDGKGNRLWRLMRPDGRYTFWYADKAGAVNELVGNVQLMFLTQGRYNLAEMIQHGGSRQGAPLGIYRARRLPRKDDRLTGFENLGADAAGELCSLWLGKATHYGVGMGLSPDFRTWHRQPGRLLVPFKLKEAEAPDSAHVVQNAHVYTPLHLARYRFLVYWNRMLGSGWVTPQSAGERLVQEGMLTRGQLDKILQLGQPRKLNLSRTSGVERRRLMKLYPGGIRPGDMVAMNHELAEQLADLNTAHMLVNMPGSGLPRSVQQWFCLAPFTFGLESGTVSGIEHMPLRMNRDTAEQFRKLIPLVNALRKQQKEGVAQPLDTELHAAYAPDEVTRCEQGWCFAMAGEGAFRGAGQSLWNLLLDPARARSLMTQEEQVLIDERIRPLCGNREPSEALQELSELLLSYPELHHYGVPDSRSNALCRMRLDETEGPAGPGFSLFRVPGVRMLQPSWVERGYTLEADVELPAAMRDDSRVMPALRLLDGLRRLTADSPYTDAQGIHWRNERYGGADGRRPGKLDESWAAEPAVQPLLDFYHRVALAPGFRESDGRLQVCGVELGGITPGELKPEALEHITIYRHRQYPDQMVRLMPGSPGAANPRQCVPYVVHTSDGVPLLSRSMVRSKELLPQALHALSRYEAELERSFSYERTAAVRREQMDGLLHELLEVRAADPQSWSGANGRDINNLELFMQIFQDSRLPYALADKEPAKLTRGEALTVELARLVLLAECGMQPGNHINRLVDFAARLRENPVDMQLLRLTLQRVVSPFPEEYGKGELNPRLIEEKLKEALNKARFGFTHSSVVSAPQAQRLRLFGENV